MHLMFQTIAKLANAYAAIHNSEVYVEVEDDGSIKDYASQSKTGEKSKSCWFFYKEDGKPEGKSMLIHFNDLLPLIEKQEFTSIAHEGLSHNDWPLDKMIEFEKQCESKEYRDHFFSKYPRMKKPLDKNTNIYTNCENKYWRHVPLKEFIPCFINLKSTIDTGIYEFYAEYDDGGEWVRIDFNHNRITDMDHQENPCLLIHSNNFNPKGIDLYRYIAEKYDIWYEDYMEYDLI